MLLGALSLFYPECACIVTKFRFRNKFRLNAFFVAVKITPLDQYAKRCVRRRLRQILCICREAVIIIIQQSSGQCNCIPPDPVMHVTAAGNEIYCASAGVVHRYVYVGTGILIPNKGCHCVLLECWLYFLPSASKFFGSASSWYRHCNGYRGVYYEYT